jgi:hypothetical protein
MFFTLLFHSPISTFLSPRLSPCLTNRKTKVDDLVFALEASNTENKYLHDEIMRLKRKSRQSLSDITSEDRDPKAFMKQQVWPLKRVWGVLVVLAARVIPVEIRVSVVHVLVCYTRFTEN